MKEQSRNSGYYPTVWIDACDQDAVFVQSRDLPQRESKKTDANNDFFQMNQDVDFYRCIYEYGYLNGNSKNKEKYIKKYTQSIDNPHLQVEQLLYRGPRISPNHFISTTRIIEGKKTRNFILSEYNRTNYQSGNILLYPCVVENGQEETIATIKDKNQEEEQYSYIQSAINSGEEYLKFIHTGKFGNYGAYVPLVLDEIVTRDLFKYFNTPNLPGIEEYVVMPEELYFYIELEPTI